MIAQTLSIRAGSSRFRVLQFGGAKAPPLVLLHGFLGAAEHWARLAPRWASDRAVFAVDLPGHGGTATADGAFAFERQAAAVRALVELLSPGVPAHLYGYSMGGRLALEAALQGLCVSSLILESVHPGLATDAERAERARADEAWAKRLECEPRGDFMGAWNAQPVFAGDFAPPQDAGGDARALAAALRGAGLAMQPDQRPRLAALAGTPVLLVAGSLDAKFRALAAEMHAALPSSALYVVEGAGHRVSHVAPHGFSERIAAWLVAAGRPLNL